MRFEFVVKKFFDYDRENTQDYGFNDLCEAIASANSFVTQGDERRAIVQKFNDNGYLAYFCEGKVVKTEDEEPENESEDDQDDDQDDDQEDMLDEESD